MTDTERLRELTTLLESIAADRRVLDELPDEQRDRLLRAVADVYSPDRYARRRQSKDEHRARKASRAQIHDRIKASAAIRTLHRRAPVTTPNVFPPEGFEAKDVDRDADAALDGGPGSEPRESIEPQHCYVCKARFTVIHHFYDQLCPDCAPFNFAKRTELADLRGRVALLTGGRVKIGYQTGLKLLRCGAHVIVTTRFPRDSATRYAGEPDFAEWADRLEVFGLDLRHTPSVEAFCREMIATRPRLDFIVNNACQTVRRPPDFYAHMMAGEQAAVSDMPEHVRRLIGAYEGLRGYHLLPEGGSGEAAALDRRLAGVSGLTHAAALSQVPLLAEELQAQRDLFPEGKLDADLQQVDLRGRNSWRLVLHEVSAVELLEVQLVNAVAPFILNARLKPLLLKTPDRDKHIVNVSAVEGQFYRTFKTTRHPHTNMAKAALNMMTRTAATDYHADGIHMNSVDTGWVTDEDPVEIAQRKTADHRFHPPLDIVDGAARIVDPIISGFNTGTHVWGQFLKDYQADAVVDDPADVVLRTPRLILRHWRRSDRAPFASLNADPVVMAHFPAPLTPAESDALADAIEMRIAERGFGLWALEVPGVVPFAGFVGLSKPSFSAPFVPCVEIGWRLAAAQWGSGYATEAAQAVLVHAWTALGLDEVVSFTAVGNARSRAVMARIGMRYDPADDFDHPQLAPGHPLRPHVLYRLARP